MHYFKPGRAYIGGDFIYSEPTSFCIKATDENELDNIKTNTDFFPIGLRQALLTYLVVCADYKLKQKKTCNFLVHPSVRKDDHQTFARTLGETLNTFFSELNDEETREILLDEIQDMWTDLQSSYPDIAHPEDIRQCLETILESEEIKIRIINSVSPKDMGYDLGFNIVVGGNSLGRGVTFPNLQVVYYCRKSKVQQADTFWQHSRIFGYDRERGLIRMFLPPSLHELFTDLNNSNKILIEQIVSNQLEGLQLIYPDGIKPTRKNVLDNKALNVIAGGVNFFAINPTQSDPRHTDEKLINYDEKQKYYEVSGEFFMDLLANIEEDNIDWSGKKYANCTKALLQKRPTQKFAIAIRRNSNVGELIKTRTLLSADDNRLSKNLKDHAVLILYRLNGHKEKGWKGNPFWVPNIKFPDGMNFYDTIDLN